MPVITLSSLDDPRVLPYRDLPRSSEPVDQGVLIAEGRWLVERLLASDFEVVSLLVEPAWADRYQEQLDDDVPVYVAERALIQELTGFNFHRGLLACGRRRLLREPEELTTSLSKTATLLVCDGVQNRENLGAIFRNAAAFGVEGVILGPRCADPFSRRVLRVSMGTVFKLRLFGATSLLPVIDQLRQEEQFEVIATNLSPSSIPLETASRTNRLAILVGNEAKGVDPVLLQLCDQTVTIPMQLETDSLNVGVATGIVLYHFTRIAKCTGTTK